MTNGRCANGSGFDRVSTSSTTCSTQRLRGGRGCPCGGLWVSAGVSVCAESVNGLCHPAQIRRGRRNHGRKRMDGMQVGVRFGLGAAVPAAGCGFWGACLWGKPSTNTLRVRCENHDDEWMMCKWEWFRQGFDKLNHLLNPTASGWVGLSTRRVVGFGGRVCGGKPSTNELMKNEWVDATRMGGTSDWVDLSLRRQDVGLG